MLRTLQAIFTAFASQLLLDNFFLSDVISSLPDAEDIATVKRQKKCDKNIENYQQKHPTC